MFVKYAHVVTNLKLTPCNIPPNKNLSISHGQTLLKLAEARDAAKNAEAALAFERASQTRSDCKGCRGAGWFADSSDGGIAKQCDCWAVRVAEVKAERDAATAEAAEAIMTSDTVKKEIAVEVQLSFGTVRIGGIAKGAGMIDPNMVEF